MTQTYVSIKEQMIYLFDPVNDIPWPTVGIMMYRRLRHGPNVKLTLSLDVWCYLEHAFNQSIQLCTQIVCILYVGNHHVCA